MKSSCEILHNILVKSLWQVLWIPWEYVRDPAENACRVPMKSLRVPCKLCFLALWRPWENPCGFAMSILTIFLMDPAWKSRKEFLTDSHVELGEKKHSGFLKESCKDPDVHACRVPMIPVSLPCTVPSLALGVHEKIFMVSNAHPYTMGSRMKNVKNFV